MVCSAARLSTPAPSEPPPPSDSANQLPPEGKQIRRAWREKNPHKVLAKRERQRQKHREKTGYNPEGRTCEDCNADISHRGHNAKWCVPCSTPPARTCIVCHTDISNRGVRAQFCSEDCKQHHADIMVRSLLTSCSTFRTEGSEHNSVVRTASNISSSRRSWLGTPRHVPSATRTKITMNSDFTTISGAQSAKVAKLRTSQNGTTTSLLNRGQEGVAFDASVSESKGPVCPQRKGQC